MYSKIVNRFNRTFSKSVTPYFEVEYCEATLKDASTEFADARALNLSANTLRDYNLTLSRLCNFFPENPPVSQLTHRELRKFLVIIPGGKKNKLNAYIGLCAFWTWCLREGYAREHITKRIEMPEPDEKVVMPLEEAEVRAMLAATEQGYFTNRDKAILLILLDTGLRASELCNAKVGDLHGSMIKVMGKGAKERKVPLSETTMDYISKYFAERGTLLTPDKPIVESEDRAPFTRFGLLLFVRRVGLRAGVHEVHPHRFRHTFAISYLRNGGDPYTLQKILGHSTMEMVKRYLEITEKDVQLKHLTASPVSSLHLVKP